MKCSKHAIKADNGPFKESAARMVNLGMYLSNFTNKWKIKPEVSFTDAYVEEVYESYHVLTDTKMLRVIPYAKCKKIDLYKVMETECQHLTMI